MNGRVKETSSVISPVIFSDCTLICYFEPWSSDRSEIAETSLPAFRWLVWSSALWTLSSALAESISSILEMSMVMSPSGRAVELDKPFYMHFSFFEPSVNFSPVVPEPS